MVVRILCLRNAEETWIVEILPSLNYWPEGNEAGWLVLYDAWRAPGGVHTSSKIALPMGLLPIEISRKTRGRTGLSRRSLMSMVEKIYVMRVRAKGYGGDKLLVGRG